MAGDLHIIVERLGLIEDTAFGAVCHRRFIVRDAFVAGFCSGGELKHMLAIKAQDRNVFISAVHSAWWERVCDIIECPELKSDPRFATSEARFDNADALMNEWSAARPAAEWEQLLANTGVPAAIVRTLQEFASHPYVAARETLSEVVVEQTGERIRLVGAGAKFEHDGPAFTSGVPALGAHTEEVLAELGYATDDIQALRTVRVI